MLGFVFMEEKLGLLLYIGRIHDLCRFKAQCYAVVEYIMGNFRVPCY